MPDLVTRLARKWCPQHQEGGTTFNVCSCPQTAAAIREALEAFSERIVTEGSEQSMFSTQWTEEEVAAAIAELREGE